MTQRLIDADALINSGYPTVYHTDFGDAVIDVEDIKKAPTIEMKPDPELEYRKAKAPVFMTHRYIDEETKEEGTWISVHCPVCFNNEKVRLWNSLISRDNAFCSRCGQKIKWEEEQ